MLKKRHKEIKGFILGMIFAIMLTGTAAATSPVIREIFFGVEISFNGELIEFAEDSLPFVMYDRTFLPVRAIADLVGLEVGFEGGVVTLTEKQPLPYLGFIFSPPENWNKETTRFSVSATSPLGATVQITQEQLPHPLTPQEFKEKAAEAATAEGLYVNTNFPYTTTIGNYEWFSYQTTMTMQILGTEATVQGHYFVNIDNDTARTIAIITSDFSETKDQILKMFQPM
jgi:hypothetical protein